MNANTLLVHGRTEVDPLYHAVNPPIYSSSTFDAYPKEGKPTYYYSRGSNPTRKILEDQLASIEGGTSAYSFSSGMAAISAAISVLHSGEHAIVSRSIYGGTVDVLDKVFSRWDIEYTSVNTTDLAAVERAIKPNTRLFLIESPANPTLEVTDIAKVSELAHENGALVAVDNTFMSPYLQRPLELGADIAIESATKFLGGHSDIIAGAVAVVDEEVGSQIAAFQKTIGAILAPWDAYLLHRSIKTLGLRVERSTENALRITSYLQDSPAVDRVIYPGLPDHPGHAVHVAQSDAPGALLSFELNEQYDPEALLAAFDIITPGASLGGVESLVGRPVTGSHDNLSPQQLEFAGIKPNLIRFSAGIEEADDLIADFDQAFAAAKRRER